MKKLRKAWLTVVVALTAILALSACGSAKMTGKDAKKYAQSVLDASYKGEFTEYMKQTDSSKKEAEEMYNNGIDLTMEASGLDDTGVSDELKEKYRQLFIDIYKKAEYTLEDARGDGDDAFTIDVKIKPFTLFNGMEDELQTAIQEKAATMSEVTDDMVDELVYQTMYDLLSAKLDNLQYGDETTVTLHVKPDDDGVYYIPDDDLQEVENALVPQ